MKKFRRKSEEKAEKFRRKNKLQQKIRQISAKFQQNFSKKSLIKQNFSKKPAKNQQKTSKISAKLKTNQMMKKNNHPNRDWRPKWKFENGIATHLPTGRAYTRDENNEIIICKAEENPVSDDGKLYRQAKKLLSASPPEPSTEAN